MTRCRILILLAGILAAGAASGRSDQPTVLRDVRYGVQPGSSRVTLVFAGEIRFSTDHGKSIVRMGFSNTHLAPTPGTSRYRFARGLVQSVVIGRLQPDSLTVAVTLRENTAYRCVQPSGGNELHIEVFPNGVAAPPVARRTPVRTPATASPRAPSEPAPAGPALRDHAVELIDIAAIARAQVEGVPNSTAADSCVIQPPLQTSKAGSPFALIAAMVLIGLTSAVLAIMLMQQYASHVPRSAAPQPGAAPVAPPVRADAPDSAPSHDAEFAGPDEEAEESERETSLQLARSFRRGSEEINLARRMHTQPSAPLSVGKMQQMLERSTTATQRLHAARKLGVGRGELDLALKLKTIRSASETKEEGQ